MTIEEAKKKLIDIAKAEIGYHEKASNKDLDDKKANSGDKNWTKYARDLDNLGYYNGRKNGYEWCDVFVDWCFTTAFGFPRGQEMEYQPTKSLGAGCKYSYNYYKLAKATVEEPEVGDQIFFRYSTEIAHTGLVWKVTAQYVYTIEGNVNGEVVQKTYLKKNKSIFGYGRPNWSLVADEPTPAPVPMPVDKPVLKRGDSGSEVKKMQNQLIAHGYPLEKYGADGDFGAETETAVKKFQKDRGLVPDGIVGKMTHAELDKAPAKNIVYTVQRGDTLSKIASKYGTTVAKIAELNGIYTPNLIRIGQQIKIPIGG